MLNFFTRQPALVDLSAHGFTPAALTQKGQLVSVVNSDTHFHHDKYLRAYVRLYQQTTVPLPYEFHVVNRSDAQPVKNILPPLDKPRVIKWIVGAAEGATDNFVVYWDDTVVENFQGCQFTAEFKWQPTSEVIEDLYKEDVENHLSWWNPPKGSLSSQLRKGLAKRWIRAPRVQRALYEEDICWDVETGC